MCLGTRNPSKISGVSRAISAVFGKADVVPVETRTRIPPQPMGLSVVIEGARRRAIAAFREVGECDIGIGIEAGLYLLKDRVFDVQVAYVVTADGSESFGLSPSFIVPDSFVKSLVLGETRELDEVVYRELGVSDVGSCGGLIKMLTNSVVTREDLTYYATLMALVPLINRERYLAELER
ncbi:MAG: inosine/xanthosine triphosphatase [Sulfolobales archaeon]|nr:inosine/xanthosine triphosphatase [Sulfolobales archaeon]MCX8208606.1 inosine/xanthosine triphosphatase [Sulfolobales archaeon]MDW8011052.1 inosine/xanthosine triphosphatase [Sulfolobales archaeon]